MSQRSHRSSLATIPDRVELPTPPTQSAAPSWRLPFGLAPSNRQDALAERAEGIEPINVAAHIFDYRSFCGRRNIGS
jgi:hypothetical protein